jgi:hypothetical protein
MKRVISIFNLTLFRNAIMIIFVMALFAACKKDDFKADPEQSTKVEITTNVDDKGAYVFNKDNEKVYLVGEDGFTIDPEDAVNMSPTQKDEGGFYVGEPPEDGGIPSVSWDELKNNSKKS